jgi:hypothetical protein
MGASEAAERLQFAARGRSARGRESDRSRPDRSSDTSHNAASADVYSSHFLRGTPDSFSAILASYATVWCSQTS